MDARSGRKQKRMLKKFKNNNPGGRRYVPTTPVTKDDDVYIDMPKIHHHHHKYKLCRWMSYINTVCIVVLFVLVFVLRPVSTESEPKSSVVLVRQNKATRVYPFNFVPTDPVEKLMVLSLSQSGMIYDNVQYYDVCCRNSDFMVCRSVTQNMSIDCVLQNTAKGLFALVFARHTDMVGARCRLLWSEKSSK